MKKLFLKLFLIVALSSYGQESLTTKKITEVYKTKLNLSDDQATKLALVIDKFDAELSLSNVEKKAFNKTNKLRDLEVYKILTKEQFDVYKKVKLEIEPQLKYRFE